MADAPRHKSLRTRLQRQLEFYLSESNLRQDKFLRQSMDARGFVPAQLFLSFNRLKALKATERLVLEVADKSPLLRADLAAASIAPLALPDADSHDADANTVYIEGFGAEDDHDSLRRMFAQFGKVNLVSMPRFQQSRKFKGFAFVEFAAVDAAEAAVKAAAAREPSLGGIRAMSKLRWLNLKEQLKAKLLEAEGGAGHQDPELSAASGQAPTGSDGNTGACPSDVGASQTQAQAQAPRKKKKKRSAHIHFGSSDSEDEDEGASDARDALKRTRIE